MTTSRTTARPFERVLAPARAALDWLDGATASIALAVLTVAVGVPAQLWPDALAGLAAAPADPTRVWTLLTSTVWVGSWGTLVGAVVVWLTLGAWTEVPWGHGGTWSRGWPARAAGSWSSRRSTRCWPG